MADINDLLIRIDATTEQMRREMKKAENTTQATASKIDGYLAKIDGRFQRMTDAASRAKLAIGAVIGALAVRQLVNFTKQQAEIADAIGKAALVAGTTTDQIQELRFAFGQLAGTQDREVDESLRRLNRRLGLATDGVATYTKAFDDLGVTITENSGKFRSTSDVLEDVLNSLALIESDAARAAAASQVFGEDAGPKLAAALGDGIGAVTKLRRELNEGGGVISDEAISKAAELNDLFDKINRTISAETADTILKNASAISMLAEAIGKVTSAAVGGVATVVDFVRWIGEELAARIHGIASDDLPRLTGALIEAEKNLEMVRSRIGGRSNAARRDELIAQAEEEVRIARERLEVAKLIVEQTKARTKPAPSSSGGGGVTTKKPEAPFDSSELVLSQRVDKIKAATAEVDSFFQSTRTEAEQIEAQIARVQELASQGFFALRGVDDQQILERLNEQLVALEEKTETASTKMAETLANNVGGAIDELFASGKLNAESFAESVLRDLARIAVQLYIMKPLIEGLFGQGGGASAFGKGVFKALGFAKGTDFVVPGSGAADSRFYPMMLSPGERVRISPPGKSSGSDVQVNITTTGSPNDVSVSESNVDGMRVVDVMIDNALMKKFANGSIDRLFSASGMNVRRGGIR